MTVTRRRSHRWRRRRRRRRTYISNSQRAGPPDGNAIKFSRFSYAERNRRAPSQRHLAPSPNYASGRYPPSSPVILSRYTLRPPPLSRTVPSTAHSPVTTTIHTDVLRHTGGRGVYHHRGRFDFTLSLTDNQPSTNRTPPSQQRQ